MATVLLFHHAQGQTPGFLTFADDLRAAGHTIHAPDLYDGRTFRDLGEGVAYAEHEALVEKVPTAELFLYPGSAHLFADPSTGDYDEEAAVLLKERTLAFLRRVGEAP